MPAEVSAGILHRLYYEHVFCHVFHQVYIVARGQDPAALEHQLLDIMDARQAAYPAEHNVGHLYKASLAQVMHFTTQEMATA